MKPLRNSYQNASITAANLMNMKCSGRTLIQEKGGLRYGPL